MGKQTIDPIIAEMRAVRDAHAARFDYDVAAIFRDIRAMQKMSGRDYVRYPARSANSSDTGIDLRDVEVGSSATGSTA
ncbi:MAG: hypothetical protein OXI52_10720 [Caldilineaceae bacterium]|nr:hypothetical protein [Caldilineaceae bacterium]